MNKKLWLILFVCLLNIAGCSHLEKQQEDVDEAEPSVTVESPVGSINEFTDVPEAFFFSHLQKCYPHLFDDGLPPLLGDLQTDLSRS
jgi:hypothetical protein